MLSIREFSIWSVSATFVYFKRLVTCTVFSDPLNVSHHQMSMITSSNCVSCNEGDHGTEWIRYSMLIQSYPATSFGKIYFIYYGSDSTIDSKSSQVATEDVDSPFHSSLELLLAIFMAALLF